MTLACGSGSLIANNGLWNHGDKVGVVGQDNFAANSPGATFDIGFMQWEPGPSCSTFIDSPYFENDFLCNRYFQKSYNPLTPVGTATVSGALSTLVPAGLNVINQYVPFRESLATTAFMTIYSPHSGAANSVYDATAGVDRGVTSVGNISNNSYNGIHLSSSNASQATYQWQHTADTFF